MCPRYWYDANKEVHSATHLSQAGRRKQEGSNRTAHQGTERDDLSNSVNTVIPQFRHHVENEKQPLEKREGQQQVLHATFPGIGDACRVLLEVRADALARKFHEIHDMAVKDEIERLAREYAKLNEPWVFRP